jgi:hypothetical protein
MKPTGLGIGSGVAAKQIRTLVDTAIMLVLFVFIKGTGEQSAIQWTT